MQKTFIHLFISKNMKQKQEIQNWDLRRLQEISLVSVTMHSKIWMREVSSVSVQKYVQEIFWSER